MADTDSTLGRIDQTLTFYSTGLGQDLAVRERPPSPNDVLSQVFEAVAEAFRPIFDACHTALVTFGTAMQPFVDAAQRRDRWRKVLCRWNEPDMRATMWDRKTARTSRTWKTRQVGR